MHILYNEFEVSRIMADYKEMYREMFIAATKAIEVLVEAQQKCEDLYINAEAKEHIIQMVEKIKTEE